MILIHDIIHTHLDIESVVVAETWQYPSKLNGTESQRTPFSKLRSSY